MFGEFVPKMLFEASGAIFWSLSIICLKVQKLQPVLSINPLSPNIHVQILQTDLYTFPLRIS